MFNLTLKNGSMLAKLLRLFRQSAANRLLIKSTADGLSLYVINLNKVAVASAELAKEEFEEFKIDPNQQQLKINFRKLAKAMNQIESDFMVRVTLDNDDDDVGDGGEKVKEGGKTLKFTLNWHDSIKTAVFEMPVEEDVGDIDFINLTKQSYDGCLDIAANHLADLHDELPTLSDSCILSLDDNGLDLNLHKVSGCSKVVINLPTALDKMASLTTSGPVSSGKLPASQIDALTTVAKVAERCKLSIDKDGPVRARFTIDDKRFDVLYPKE